MRFLGPDRPATGIRRTVCFRHRLVRSRLGTDRTPAHQGAGERQGVRRVRPVQRVAPGCDRPAGLPGPGAAAA